MNAFFAYPSSHPEIVQTIESALNRGDIGAWAIQPWSELPIAGRMIANEVLEAIDAADALIADVSHLNFNVTFEIGYAIGRKKPVVLVRNEAYADTTSTLRAVGVFDTIGYVNYQNSEGLRAAITRSLDAAEALDIPADLSTKAPAYLVQPRFRTEFINNIVSRLKQAKILFRNFDAAEFSRLPAQEAIEQVSKSYGVVIPLESPNANESISHNLRCAFVAGLAYGLDKAVAILQNGEAPVPLDVRDFAIHVMHPNQIGPRIQEFAADVIDAMQRASELTVPEPETLLQRLHLGASSAENEFRDLANYYLKTDSFLRTNRGEARIVTGRKGSGKTAIFFQVRDSVRASQTTVVLDLKPDGYKLLKFREAVAALITAGAFEHTVMAIWEYVLLLEVCHKILESDNHLHKRDHRLYDPYRKLFDLYHEEGYDTEGDFNERMSQLLSRIEDDYRAKLEEGCVNQSLSSAEVTELIFKHDVRGLREAIEEYLHYKDEVWLLIDNLDKGWPTHGVEPSDLVLIRTLLDASRKLERQLGRVDVECHSTVFLRNDVYELLIDETPDRGKESRVSTDWTDREMFREMLRRRLVYANFPPNTPFGEIWPRICTPYYDGEESSEYLINRSLMRPRYLLDLVMHCRGVAVNRGNERIEAEDIQQALKTHSTSLLTDIGLEIRDIRPDAGEVLYGFIDVPNTLSVEQVHDCFRSSAIEPGKFGDFSNILLWFGFLGIVEEDGSEKYIYDYEYNSKLMDHVVEKRNKNGKLKLAVNPAFHSALEIRV